MKRKKPKKKSPLQRTLKFLRDRGYTVGITEHYNAFIHIRQDFCGFADCIAFKPGVPILAINAMYKNDRSHHTKFLDNEKLRTWVESGHRFEMHQWHGEVGSPVFDRIRLVLHRDGSLAWYTVSHEGRSLVSRTELAFG